MKLSMQAVSYSLEKEEYSCKISESMELLTDIMHSLSMSSSLLSWSRSS